MNPPTGIDTPASLPLVSPIERLGASILDGINALGRFVLFLLFAVAEIAMPPYKLRLVLRQIRTIGAESFFLVALIGMFTGMVLGLQGEFTLRKFGSEGALGTVVSLVLVRELGPVLTALMVTARAGSAMAAEIGSMQVTEQIDALTVMAINPVQYLVSPRIIAGVISFPLLTSMFDVIGIMGGYAVGVGMMGAPSASYFNGIAQNLTGGDVRIGLYKALVFGLIVAWASCYKGYNAQRMATGVSRATTEAVVLSSVLILMFDYFLTSFLLR
ncbi:MAG TPA: ABC transporter permease [Candidatus Binataceae bacterium]|jgi:phospholipid/cholesterol/gamma-HCH transport system permease protein|nr:ABC transporter permease [Candidatus Binataceae bacterium]